MQWDPRMYSGTSDDGRGAETLAADVEGARLAQFRVVLSARTARSSRHRNHRRLKSVEQLAHSVEHVLNHLHTAESHRVIDVS